MDAKKVLLWGTALAGLLVTDQTLAAPNQITPSLVLREEFHDNLFFARQGSEEEEYISTATPGISLSRQSARFTAELKGWAEALDYAEHRELNAVDRFGTVGLLYSLTENIRLRGNADYGLDSRIDRDLETTGLILSSEEREKQGYGLSSDFSLSEVSMLSVNCRFNRQEYVDPEFSDFKASSAGFGFTHDFSRQLETAVGRLNGSFMRYDYSGFQVENYNLTLGGSFALSEKYSLLLDVGPRYSRSEFEAWMLLFGLPTGRITSEENDGWGWAGSVTLNYSGEVTQGRIYFSRDLAESSGRNGTTERTSAGLELSREITDALRFSLNSSYFLNESAVGEFAAQETDTETWQVGPRLSYRFNQELTLRLSYSYTAVDDKVTEVEQVKNVAWLELRYDYPLFD